MPAPQLSPSFVIVTATVAAAAWTTTAGDRHGPLPDWRVVAVNEIAQPAPGGAYLESWLAVDPQDSDRMIATAIAVGTVGAHVFATADGGSTWSEGTHTEGDETFPGGDPIVVFTADGVAWFSTIEDRMHLWRSDDGGHAWTASPDLPGGTYDRQFLAAGTGPDAPYLAASGKIVGLNVFDAPIAPDREYLAVTWSRDGASFGSPRMVMPLPTERALQAPMGLLVRSDGRLVVPYIAWLLPSSGVITHRLHGRVSVTASDRRGGFRESVDVGEIDVVPTRGEPDPVKARLGLGVGGAAQDMGIGPRAGAIYLVWSTLVGDEYRLRVSASGDDGATWRQPTAVSPSTSGDQVSPAIAVGPDGTVAVVWNDFGSDPDGVCFQVKFAASEDGGQTFSDPITLNTVPSCAAAPLGPIARPSRLLADGKVDPESAAFRWINGGDTQGIEALPDGSFSLAWINASQGAPGLWFARISRR